MDDFKAFAGYFLKSKWAQGHRRDVSVALTVINLALMLAAGPVGALVPALTTATAHTIIMGLSAYFGGMGVLFKNDPIPAS